MGTLWNRKADTVRQLLTREFAGSFMFEIGQVVGNIRNCRKPLGKLVDPWPVIWQLHNCPVPGFVKSQNSTPSFLNRQADIQGAVLQDRPGPDI